MVVAFRIVCIVSLIFIGSFDFSKSYVISNRGFETAKNGPNIDNTPSPIPLFSSRPNGFKSPALGISLDSFLSNFERNLKLPVVPQPAPLPLFRESVAMPSHSNPHPIENGQVGGLPKGSLDLEKGKATSKEGLKTGDNEKSSNETVNPKALEGESKVESEPKKKFLSLLLDEYDEDEDQDIVGLFLSLLNFLLR